MKKESKTDRWRESVCGCLTSKTEKRRWVGLRERRRETKRETKREGKRERPHGC